MGVQSPSTGVFRAQPQTSSSLCRVLTSLAEADGPQVLTLLQEVLGVLRERPRTWQDCVAWALGHWQRRFMLIHWLRAAHPVVSGILQWIPRGE